PPSFRSNKKAPGLNPSPEATSPLRAACTGDRLPLKVTLASDERQGTRNLCLRPPAAKVARRCCSRPDTAFLARRLLDGSAPCSCPAESSGESNMTAVQVENLRKEFFRRDARRSGLRRRRRRVPALDGITFTIERGECVAIL